ncbi:MAG: glutaredoxin family protein [Synechococcaceae cyanobacterium]|nr:glutaredoxin family protein [Synechococcaceae cyanobacterium]
MAHQLLLFTRAGCCLCEGLEERLRALDPPPNLCPVDVDGDPALAARYGLAVPVLALRSDDGPEGRGAVRELPRVPPRLAGERLQAWLLRQGVPQGRSLPPTGA